MLDLSWLRDLRPSVLQARVDNLPLERLSLGRQLWGAVRWLGWLFTAICAGHTALYIATIVLNPAKAQFTDLLVVVAIYGGILLYHLNNYTRPSNKAALNGAALWKACETFLSNYRVEVALTFTVMPLTWLILQGRNTSGAFYGDSAIHGIVIFGLVILARQLSMGLKLLLDFLGDTPPRQPVKTAASALVPGSLQGSPS